jgi:hypothetical protein
MARRVLDLDLDFFLDDVVYGGLPNERCSDEYRPWEPRDVREFLETRCGLSRKKPVPGKFVRHHDGAFYFWRRLIRSGQLDAPFDLIHVDAHADLGCMAICPHFFFCDYLHRSIKQRCRPPRKKGGDTIRGINAGNYLCFAVACHWLKSIIYVKHPESEDDLTHMMFKDENPECGAIQLRVYDPSSQVNSSWYANGSGVVVAHEPEVPFAEVVGTEFVASEPFDFMVLCHSPGFTPLFADRLIPIIREYMVEI